MQRTVQDGVFTKSVDYVAQLQLSDVYAKRLAAFSEQYLMEKLKDLDTKIYQQLKQKSQKMRTSILECREMHDQILTLSSELERVQALNTVVHNISIE